MQWVDRGSTLRPSSVAFVLLAWGLFDPTLANAQGPCQDPSARILSIDRQVDYRAAKTAVYVPASVSAEICQGDTIRTGDRSRATIVFVDNTRLVIDQNTEWVVRAPAQPNRTLIELIRGAILFFTRDPRGLDVHTPFVNASVEGTEFLVRVGADSADVIVYEGRVTASNPQGSITLVRNESATAAQGQPPQRRVIVRPRDAVQWAVYYEPVLPEIRSLDQLDAVPEAQRDAGFYAARAGLLLDVGRLDAAREDIDRALRLEPQSADAYSLRAIIAVALNDRDEALANGRRAVELTPDSATARVAVSYALQANFQLEQARDELLEAVAAHPDNARAWSRLAELWMSLGYLGKAQDAARRAVSLSPTESRAQSVLGFAALARVDIAEARSAFERAIELDPGNPLARLGLGLAKIRRGHLADGRADIEIAVALSPDDSIARSYLGKAYFDERRNSLSAHQFQTAKQLDPSDPTPWFYDALRRQTVNDPVTALADLQRSIALNDDRLVYRSRLLLDQDLAARSASLGRIYRDLGFEQLAYVAGWRALDANPADSSGHRLLADTYSALPRHERARVSELLQAQLLQPVNITPVAPQLAETGLFLLEGSGPSAAAFNEFNPLFNRNRLALQVGGVIGNESVFGDEVTASGIWNRASFSVGQFHYDADGFRANNDQERNIYNAFFQVQLASGTSLQGELRRDELDSGDLVVNFDPTDFSPVQASHSESDTYRIGMRHELAPKSVLIGSVYARTLSTTISDTEALAPGFEVSQLRLSDTDGWTAEIRHLYQAGRLALSSGLGHFQSDRTTTLKIAFPGLPFDEKTRDQPKQTNVYAYSSIQLPASMILNIGASGDFYRQDPFERNQFNPKLGLTWTHSGTTLRAAAFRTLHRSAVSSQTIEPTQLAGFNQFFADQDGTEARHYGLAIDQQLGSRAFAALSHSWRDLRIPVSFGDLSNVSAALRDGAERFFRTYVYWTPSERISLTSEYAFQRLERDPAATVEEAFSLIQTHRAPFAVRYFSPSGISASAAATFFHQRGDFFTRAGQRTIGQDSGWSIDVSGAYRLPRRYGKILVEIDNLFNEEFAFQDIDPANPTIRRGRQAALKFILAI